jgi:hypothetical protein
VKAFDALPFFLALIMPSVCGSKAAQIMKIEKAGRNPCPATHPRADELTAPLWPNRVLGGSRRLVAGNRPNSGNRSIL